MFLKQKMISFLWLSLAFCGHAAGTEIIRSPSGSIQVHCNLKIETGREGSRSRFTFNIFYKGNLVLQDSPTGLSFRDLPSLEGDFRIYHLESRSGQDIFRLPFGNTDTVRCAWNETVFYLQERYPPFRVMEMHFRVSEEGVAFRYRVPDQAGLSEVELTGEETAFQLAEGLLYALPLESFTTTYEANYWTGRPREMQPSTLLGLPLLMRTPHAWLLFTEAGLKNYGGMYLRKDPKNMSRLLSEIAPRRQDAGISARLKTPFVTPWRVILVQERPVPAASPFILSLNDKPAYPDTDWIKPGKCVWPEWSGHWAEGEPFSGKMNTDTYLYYLQFAADHGLEYLLIDAGWYGDPESGLEDITTPNSGLDLSRILQQGKESGVGIFLWLNLECVENQMEKAFPIYRSWGVAGVRIGRINRDDQETVRFLHRVLEAAGKHRLMVVFDGAYKPTGIRRTYPHLLTRTAVLGQPWNRGSVRCDPEHALMVPFIRMAAGPVDFGPGCFRTVQENYFDPHAVPPLAMGTRMHQLAMYVIFESPLQMCVDHPAAYSGQPGIELLQALPTVWDETRFIDGEPGDFIITARRKGSEWFVAAMTDWTPRTLSVPLSFLQEGAYRSEMHTDSPNARFEPRRIRRYSLRVTRNDTLDLLLGPGGGAVVHLILESADF
ncbi:MAG TPA: glycoside hydrolase family 97 protein [bacterium]|nr:glycoside hydrolase family 97 protein [bacterium]